MWAAAHARKQRGAPRCGWHVCSTRASTGRLRRCGANRRWHARRTHTCAAAHGGRPKQHAWLCPAKPRPQNCCTTHLAHTGCTQSRRARAADRRMHATVTRRAGMSDGVADAAHTRGHALSQRPRRTAWCLPRTASAHRPRTTTGALADRAHTCARTRVHDGTAAVPADRHRRNAAAARSMCVRTHARARRRVRASRTRDQARGVQRVCARASRARERAPTTTARAAARTCGWRARARTHTCSRP